MKAWISSTFLQFKHTRGLAQFGQNCTQKIKRLNLGGRWESSRTKLCRVNSRENISLSWWLSFRESFYCLYRKAWRALRDSAFGDYEVLYPERLPYNKNRDDRWTFQGLKIRVWYLLDCSASKVPSGSSRCTFQGIEPKQVNASRKCCFRIDTS